VIQPKFNLADLKFKSLKSDFKCKKERCKHRRNFFCILRRFRVQLKLL